MSISQLITILRARWKMVFGIWIGLVALVMAASLILPSKYTSSAEVVIDVKAPDPIAGTILPGGLTPGYMATQADILRSDRVILRALTSLGLNQNADLRTQWLDATSGVGSFDSWLAQEIRGEFDIRPSRESNVMGLSFRSPSADFSASMVNALMQAYIDTTLELKVEPARQYYGFFDERSKQLRDALESTQSKLSAYQQQNGLLATDERFDVENARLVELSSQVVALQNMAADAKGRGAQAILNADQMTEVLTNPVVAQISTDIARQQAKLDELNERLGPRHPDVISTKSSIDGLRKKLASATRAASGSVDVSNRVAQLRLQEARSTLDAQRTKVLELKKLRDQAAVLQRDVENAQRAYDAALARVGQAETESQNRQTNVSILKTGTPSPKQSSPRVLLNTALSLVVGLLLGIAAAVARELADRRIRVEEDIVQTLGMPLLIRLPSAEPGRLRISTRTKLLQNRVLTGIPQVSK